MFLKNLQLTNFRNYHNLDLDFDDRPTILIGNNAAGKSNLLESIYLLSTTKSQRVEKESELIRQGEQLVRVDGVVVDGENEDSLEVVIQNSENEDFGKRLRVNGVGRRAVDFIGNLPAVIFYPSDINMVTGSPSLRRWHLDLALAQIDPTYKRALTLYEQFLSARNKLLKVMKEGVGNIDELTYWTDELVKNGAIISDARAAFFSTINSTKQPLGEFVFEYKQSLITESRSKEYQGREIAAGATLIGPHRDDFTLKLGGRDLAHFGSRGEQRTATLSFKLAQLDYMTLSLGKRPILLLDDVFSELDASHRASVVEIVGHQQTIMATVELENIPKDFLDSARILKVEDGKIVV